VSRLAVLIPSMGGGGAERVVVNLLAEFVERGIEVDLLLVRPGGPLMGEIPPKVRIVRLGGGRILAALPSLVAYLRRRRPDALLSHLDAMNVVALLAKRLAAVPTRVVVTVHIMLSQHAREGTIRDRTVACLVPRIYPWADAIVGVSAGVVEEIADRVDLGAEAFRVIYNPIASSELLARADASICEGRDDAMLSPVDLPTGMPFLLSVGRLTRQKNHELLLEAFAKVILTEPDMHLVILGEGPERDRLERRTLDLGLSGRVHLPGFIADTAPFFRHASAFVLSSDWEGLANVLIEALAFGRPIVSTRCPSGPEEILDGGEYGRLVPTNAAEALAEAIREVLHCPPEPEPLRARARDFGVERAASEYLDILFPAGQTDTALSGTWLETASDDTAGR